MSLLPKVNHPIYELELPSNNQKIKFRGFKVSEKKILMMALTSQEPEQMFKAVQQVVNNCIIYPENINVLKLPMTDVEFLILQIRARADGEILKLKFEPTGNTECEYCKKPRIVELNLLDVKVFKYPEHNKKILLEGELGVIMKDPTFNLLKDIQEARSSQDMNKIFKIMAKCIEQIFDTNKLHDCKDFTTEQVVEFLEDLSGPMFEKIDAYFDTLPELRHDLTIECPKCDFSQTFPMRGLFDFLT